MLEIKGKVNTAICYASVIEEEAIEQIRRMCDYEFTAGSRIRIMPDVHAGKGCTIGTTMTITDKAVPNIVETGQMRLKPGAAEILKSLEDNKIPAGLASSSPRVVIDKVLGPHDLLRYFDTIVSGDMVERGKPDPEIFLKCAAQLGIPESKYSETFVIEDSHNGIRAAYAAGMQPVMVPDLLPATDEMRRLSAAVLPSLTEVTEWLQSR